MAASWRSSDIPAAGAGTGGDGSVPLSLATMPSGSLAAMPSGTWAVQQCQGAAWRGVAGACDSRALAGEPLRGQVEPRMLHDSTGPLRVAVVGAGESTCVEQVIRGLPDTVGFAVVVSSPLAPAAVRIASRLPVTAVEDRARVEHGRVYVVPFDREVRFAQGHLVVGARGGEVAPLDTILRSVADAYLLRL